MWLNKFENCMDEVVDRVNKGMNMIRALNSVLWNGRVTSRKKRMLRSLVQSVKLYVG